MAIVVYLESKEENIFQGVYSEPTYIIHMTESEFSSRNDSQRHCLSAMESIQSDEDTHQMAHRSSLPRFLVDGSWKETYPTSGVGWACWQGEQLLCLGARGQRRWKSPLHSEMEALLWAMENILERGVSCQVFETDCSYLLCITQCPEEWPAFSVLMDMFGELRDRFPLFFLSLITRSNNLKGTV